MNDDDTSDAKPNQLQESAGKRDRVARPVGMAMYGDIAQYHRLQCHETILGPSNSF